MWRCTEAADERHYSDPEERKSFVDGYNDGFRGFPQCPSGRPINSYSAGYWEGFADKETDQ